MSDKKPVLLSGIQPTGYLCIGNYLGAIKNWVALQDKYDSIFLVVDLHALTVQQKPAELRQRCLSYIAQYIACGINPEKSTIVMQSHVPQHAELMWILSTITYMGELNRMTQFKDKSKKHSANINAGLFSYPVLMASDILIYQADLVPVGADQKQHLELARNLAERFNSQYSETFVVPEPYIPDSGARIMSLQEPDKKMSKSDENVNNFIALLDSTDIIRKKIMRAVTDSSTEIVYEENRASLYNLINIYSFYSSQSPKEIVENYQGKMYSDFKKDLGEIIVEALKPMQEEYNVIINDKAQLDSILSEGRDKARYLANKTLSKVYRKIGLIAKTK